MLKEGDDPTSLSTSQLIQALRVRILSGEFPEGKLPTLKELEIGKGGLKASRYASRVAFKMLSEEGLIDFRGKLGTFVRKGPSLTTHRRRRGLIALVAPAFGFDFIAEVEHGIIRYLNDRNHDRPAGERYRLVCESSESNCKIEGRLLRELTEEVDGIILLPVHTADKSSGPRDVAAFDAVDQARIPLRLIGRWIEEAGYTRRDPATLYPEAEIGIKVATFLQKKKCAGRIFIVGESRNSSLVLRATHIRNALEEIGLGHLVELPRLNEDRRENAGAKIAADLIKSRSIGADRSSFVVCTTDLVAIGFLKALRKAKPPIQVPKDVMVMGVDGDGLGAYITPTLTTLRMFPDRLGAAAAEAVISKVEGSEPPAISPNTIGEILLGESTGETAREAPFPA